MIENNARAEAVASLQQHLQREGIEYRLIEEPSEAEARFEFVGRFDGRPVIWLTRLSALKAMSDDTGDRMQYIEIGHETDGRRELAVGLNLAHIDPPAILKTVIMIRNYKRLREGRHEWWP